MNRELSIYQAHKQGRAQEELDGLIREFDLALTFQQKVSVKVKIDLVHQKLNLYLPPRKRKSVRFDLRPYYYEANEHQ